MTIEQRAREAAKKNRRDFERRMGAVEFRLGRDDRGNGQLGGDAVIGVILGPVTFFMCPSGVN